ncbi:MAG: tRNA threonylcarbamoyladenosine dehydratase [Ruminococcaceae bacterium]|nr:tRNA threonylcarbamoyladenosine dehydratase [Oscillospiraceae bacterium]
MKEEFTRTAMLIGEDAVEKLSSCHVAIFGIGGVGGYVAEALARSGIGTFDLVDNDTVNVTNINRQIIATHDTLGRYKTEVMKERILSINPDAKVNVYNTFYLPENSGEFDFSKYDYIVDAVDTVTAKLEIIVNAKNAGTPVISSMGTGNKLDPTRFEIADIYKTSVCPLAKVMRRELKSRGIDKLKVLYSKEEPIKQQCEEGKKPTPASISFVPSVAGLIIAGEVIKELIYEYNK